MFPFDPLPTPTPIISQLIQQANNSIQDSTKLVENISNLTAVGVLGLVTVAIILWIVIGRNRGREYQTIITQQAKQNQDAFNLYEGIVKDMRQTLADAKKDLAESQRQHRDDLQNARSELKKQQEDYRLENLTRDDRIRETIMAYTDSNNRIADIADSLRKNDQAQDAALSEIRGGVATALGEGTPVAKRTEEAVNQILTHIKDILQCLEDVRGSNSKLAGMIAPLLKVQNIAQEVKHDTGPIQSTAATP